MAILAERCCELNNHDIYSPKWHHRDFSDRDGREKVRWDCPFVSATEAELLLNYSITLHSFGYITLLCLFVWLKVHHNGVFFCAQTLEKSCFYPGSSFYVALETNNHCRYRNVGTHEKDMPPSLPRTTLYSSGPLTVLFSDFLRYTSVHQNGASVWSQTVHSRHCKSLHEVFYSCSSRYF